MENLHVVVWYIMIRISYYYNELVNWRKNYNREG